MLKSIIKGAADLINLIYPEACAACEEILLEGEKIICTNCQFDLPETDFEKYADNPMFKVFLGRVEIQQATALYYFNKDSKVQNLIHKLKYQNRKEVGVYFGNLLGERIVKSTFFDDIDIVIPVPIHQSRLKIRGYNQAEIIARTVAKKIDIPLLTKALFRTDKSESQTKKSRIQRWQSMQNAFKADNTKEIAAKHILLVDDVMTTGATLEVCAHELLKNGAAKISIATLCYTER